MSDRTIIKLAGGHSILVRMPTTQVTQIIEDSRAERPGSLTFIQSDAHGDNGLVIDHDKVVALISADDTLPASVPPV